jgi:hypothetical protein
VNKEVGVISEAEKLESYRRSIKELGGNPNLSNQGVGQDAKGRACLILIRPAPIPAPSK